MSPQELDDAGIAALRPRLSAATAAGPAVAEIAPGALQVAMPRRPAWRDGIPRGLVGVADVASAALAVLLVLVVFGRNPIGLGELVTAAFVAYLFKASGLYGREQLHLEHSTLDEVPLLLQVTGLFSLATTILLPSHMWSRSGGQGLAILWLASFTATLAGRVVARSVARRVSPVERCLVIGDGQDADALSEKLAGSSTRAAIVACVPPEEIDVTDLDSPRRIREVVKDLQVQRIIIAPAIGDAAGSVELMRVAKTAGVSISVFPRMFEAVGSRVECDEINGMTVLGIRRFGLSRSAFAAKRTFDLVATSVGLVALSPVLIAVAIAIRLDSKGPAFFRQVRVGRDGKQFEIVKFRSMVADADTRKDALRSLNEAGDGLFKLARDPRVTRVGGFLRRSSLDELPQLFNVLRGDMSLVGPRPLVTDEDDQVLGLDRSRLHLTPGMTGPWQILGARVPLQEMVAIDYLYVANWSLWRDLKVLLRTVRHVLRRGNV